MRPSASSFASIFAMNILRLVVDLRASAFVTTKVAHKHDATEIIWRAWNSGRGGGKRCTVGVDVLDVRMEQQRMQRRSDGGCPRVEIERAVRQVPHHLVFERVAALQFFQRRQPVHMQRGESVQLH